MGEMFPSYRRKRAAKTGMHDSMKGSGGQIIVLLLLLVPTHVVRVGQMDGSEPDHAERGNLHQIISGDSGICLDQHRVASCTLTQTRVNLHDSDVGKTHWVGCCAPSSYQH